MVRLNHALNISTLAAWLSVAVVASVGLCLPDRSSAAPRQLEPPALVEPLEFALSDSASASGSEISSSPTPESQADTESNNPPPLPDLSPQNPLPEIPDQITPSLHPQPTRQATAPQKRHSRSNNHFARDLQVSSTQSDAARIAAGNMPKPIYPPAAKRQKQTGTVVVQFTVNPSGQVTAAFAKSPSNWPLLDAEALRTVKTWTFPQGGMMTKTQPIIFKLE
jgi:protein TonB